VKVYVRANRELIVNSGMAEIAATSIEIEQITSTTLDETIAQARELLLAYGRFIKAQPGAAQFCFGSLEKEAERLPASYLEQDGGCLVARVDGIPRGFIAWRAMPHGAANDAWEMRRLWVEPEARGHRLGAALTDAILHRAKQAGRQAIYLYTEPQSMATAYRMYLALGFEPCTMQADDSAEGVVCLEKYL
jgi:ribosomal protein S18 acetylase RimI-like enzyme